MPVRDDTAGVRGGNSDQEGAVPAENGHGGGWGSLEGSGRKGKVVSGRRTEQQARGWYTGQIMLGGGVRGNGRQRGIREHGLAGTAHGGGAGAGLPTATGLAGRGGR